MMDLQIRNLVNTLKSPDMSIYATKVATSDAISAISSQMSSNLTNYAKKSDVPSPSTANPMSEMPSPAAGSSTNYATADHIHARITETFEGVLDSNGSKSLVFSKTYQFKPAVIPVSDSAGAAVMWDLTYQTNAQGLYTGCTITARKGQRLPDLGLISLLTNLVTTLTKFDPFGAATAGIAFTATVVKSSRVA